MPDTNSDAADRITWMKGDLLPADHHVARLCRISDLLFDQDGKVRGVNGSAFRPLVSNAMEATDVSAYWLEFFRGNYRQNILSILSTVRPRMRRTQRLAILNVGRLNALGIQVVEDPIYEPPPNTNVAHVILRGVNDFQKREAIASAISSQDIVGIGDFVDDLKKSTTAREEAPELICYLSAPANVDTRALRQTLTELDVRVATPAELPPPGESLPGEIRRSLREADFVCGVLADEPSATTNVAFELGIAAGLSRPIFVIASKHAAFPFGLQAFPYLQGNPNDVDAVRFHLSAFLKNMKQSARSALISGKPTKRPSAPQSDAIADLRRRVRNLNTSGVEMTQVVFGALRALGAVISFDERIEHGFRPDAIAWLPETVTELAGPLVIEIKRTPMRASPEITAQMARYMAAARAQAGLPVVLESGPRVEVRSVSGGYLFIVSLETLLDLAETGQLIPDLIRARNSFVHTGH